MVGEETEKGTEEVRTVDKGIVVLAVKFLLPQFIISRIVHQAVGETGRSRVDVEQIPEAGP